MFHRLTGKGRCFGNVYAVVAQAGCDAAFRHELIQAIEECARGFGGLASLREVGHATREYASNKLRRDRKVIQEALALLRAQSTGTPIAASTADSDVGTSDPSGLSLPEVSVNSG